MDQSLPPLLPESVLSRRNMPIKPEAVTFTGQYVRMLPLDIDRDASALFLCSNGSEIKMDLKSHPSYDPDELIWELMPYGPFSNIEDFREYLQMIARPANSLIFCLIDIETSQQIGVVGIINNNPSLLKTEIGHVWISPVVRRSKIILEASYLLLTHLFSLGFRRVEAKCDAVDERSNACAKKIGFIFEGVQQYFMIVKDCNQDAAWYRITDDEWEPIKSSIEQKLKN